MTKQLQQDSQKEYVYKLLVQKSNTPQTSLQLISQGLFFTPIRLGKKWVDSLLGSNSFSSYTQKDQMDEEHLPPMTPELEKLDNLEDEEENIQEVQEFEFTTYVYLRNVKFLDCMVSHKINFNLMTYEACKGVGFIPTVATKEDLAQIDNTYQMLGILKDVPICSFKSSPRHLVDIWVIDLPNVVSCILGKEWIHLSKQDDYHSFSTNKDNEENADKESDIQDTNSSQANYELERPLQE